MANSFVGVLIFIALLFICWLWQNIIHEAAHVIFGHFREGRRPLLLRPWPGYFITKDGKRKWFFAMHITTLPERFDPKGLYWCAPMIVSAAEFVILLLAFIISGCIYILPFIFASIVDHVFFWRGYVKGSEFSDGQMWRNRKQLQYLTLKED